jgi:AraC-like DNA-binding protein
MSEPVFNFHDTLLLATAFQSFLFVILLGFAKRDHHISDWFLLGFFVLQIAIPLHLLISFGDVISGRVLAYSPTLFRTFELAFWVEGPMLLWYTRSLLYREFHFRKKDFAYLVPALAYLIYTVVTFHTLSSTEQTNMIISERAMLAPSLPHTLEAIREIIFVFFGVLCLSEIRHAQEQTHHRYSNIATVDIFWLGSLITAFMVLRAWSLLIIGLAFLKPDLEPAVFDILGLIGNYSMFAIVWALIFYSLTRTDLFRGKFSKAQHALSDDDFEVDPEVINTVRKHMEFHKPYLSHYLNLEELALQLSMSPRTLSSVIKHGFHTNFYEFINSYRIEEAKVLLADPKYPDRTMIDVLGEAGFNSKATFNAFFKKLVGMTPSQYRTQALSGS